VERLRQKGKPAGRKIEGRGRGKWRQGKGIRGRGV
jgi:hypothetical protein